MKISIENWITIKEHKTRLYTNGRSQKEISDALNISYHAINCNIHTYKRMVRTS